MRQLRDNFTTTLQHFAKTLRHFAATLRHVGTLCDSFATTLRQLCNTLRHFATTLRQLYDTFRQPCDNFATTLRQLCDNFATTLRQLCDALQQLCDRFATTVGISCWTDFSEWCSLLLLLGCVALAKCDAMAKINEAATAVTHGTPMHSPAQRGAHAKFRLLTSCNQSVDDAMWVTGGWGQGSFWPIRCSILLLAQRSVLNFDMSVHLHVAYKELPWHICPAQIITQAYVNYVPLSSALRLFSRHIPAPSAAQQQSDWPLLELPQPDWNWKKQARAHHWTGRM